VGERIIAEKMRRRMLADISSGNLAPGARLSSERELAAHYGVSRSTLRRVLESLAAAGLVRRIPGRGGGTFVTHAKVEHDLSEVAGLPAYLARQGYVAGSRVLSTYIAAPDRATAQALHLPEGELILGIRRMRLADGTPISLDHARVPAERFAGLLEMPLGGSLYDLLETRFSTAPLDAEETVEVVHATDQEAALLCVQERAPLLAITRTTYDADGVPFEFSHDLFRADRTRITMRTRGRGIGANPRRDGGHVELQPVADDQVPSCAAG
jgi:GntR family transcriptional regulator